MTEIRKVAIVSASRTAFSKGFTSYKDSTSKDMLIGALQGLVDKADLSNKQIDEVVGGAVLNQAGDFNLVREAVLATTLSKYTSAYNVQQACGTSLQTAGIIMAKIASGQIESGIACGVDSVSKVPFSANPKLADRLLKLFRSKTFGQKLKCFKGFSLKELMPQPVGVDEPQTGLSMGGHCELMAKEWGITRAEQDAFAKRSHDNASKSVKSGFHKDLIAPYMGIYDDNILRHNLEMSDLERLKPAFDKKNGTITAGNATALTDGASAVLLCSEDWAKKNGFEIKATISFVAHAANDFVGGDGLLMAPTIAVDKVLKQSGLSFQDFDFYEFHEAFAAQTLCFLKAMNDKDYNKKFFNRDSVHGTIDMDKVNILGSSLAYGHPFAATGGRILGVCEKLISENTNLNRGLIAICTAGGMGVSAIVERY
ncbi:MAG: acetyl-CoA C-acyltransferase [Alphaproteobacteria bacterium]